MVTDITPEMLSDMFSNNEEFFLLDVREVWEVKFSGIEKSQTYFLPLSLLSKQGISALPENIVKSGFKIVVICHLGERSQQVANWLSEIGIPHVFNLAGGINRYALEIDPSIPRY